LGARETGKKGAEWLRAAIVAHREALKERTCKRLPYDWAMTQNNLGNALRTLGAREKGPANLKEALASYEEALKEFNPTRFPRDWAMTQFNLAIAFLTIGQRTHDRIVLENALTSADAALAVYVQVKSQYDFVQAATLRNQIVFALIEEHNVK